MDYDRNYNNDRSVEGRIRLRQWLELRLDEGSIPGVRWVDKDKGIFKMPWKHHSKHSWTEEDALIFKDWAMVTGRYREGIDQPDWPMWKTRVRCAINKAPDIEEVRAKHNLHCEYPFKVYRFVSKQESAWRANASRNASLVFGDLPLPSYMIPAEQQLSSGGGSISGCNSGSRSLLRYQPYSLRFDAANSYSDIQSRTSYPVRVMRRDGEDMYNMVRMASQNSDAGLVDIMGGWGVPTTHRGPPPDLLDPDMHQLCLRIQHLHEKVNDFIVTNPNGCCIYYGKHDDVDSPSTPEPIMPPILQYVVDRNRPYVDQLLANMHRGLILTVSHGNIFAERLCKCAVFVYVPLENGNHQLLTKLNRRERDCIFSYDGFNADLDAWRSGLGPRPHFELVLAFGQQLKENVPTDQLLFWCRVALCKAWYKLHRAASPAFMTPLAPPSDHVPLPPPPNVDIVSGADEMDEVLGVEENTVIAIANAVAQHERHMIGHNLDKHNSVNGNEHSLHQLMPVKNEFVIEDGVVQEDTAAYLEQLQDEASPPPPSTVITTMNMASRRSLHPLTLSRDVVSNAPRIVQINPAMPSSMPNSTNKPRLIRVIRPGTSGASATFQLVRSGHENSNSLGMEMHPQQHITIAHNTDCVL